MSDAPQFEEELGPGGLVVSTLLEAAGMKMTGEDGKTYLGVRLTLHNGAEIYNVVMGATDAEKLVSKLIVSLAALGNPGMQLLKGFCDETFQQRDPDR
jgi:hypothetical protein